jgi:hypothetical protein
MLLVFARIFSQKNVYFENFIRVTGKMSAGWEGAAGG